MTTPSARGHYENFPVLSLFVPAELRAPLASIYAFARFTDDLGDEGRDRPSERLVTLQEWERGFEDALTDGAEPAQTHPVLEGVARTIQDRGLKAQPFRQLIHANRIDQQRTRYETLDDLLEYCSYSANPVGRIVLALFGRDDEALWPLSDSMCTALQLANHWQGIGEDLRLRDRLYIPLEDLRRFDVNESDLLRERPTRAVRRLVAFELDRTRALLQEGAALPARFERSRRAVLRLFIRGGRAILDEIETREQDLLRARIRVPRRRALLSLLLESAAWIRHGAPGTGLEEGTPAAGSR
jgi:squalene synthase HpnC